MIKNIRTYDELVAEKKRLKEELQLQKNNVRNDFAEIKAELNPFKKIYSVVNNLTTKDKSNPLLNAGLDILIDLILQRVILSRAGWITKLAIPFFVKNYSSHILSDDKPGFFEKISSIFKKKPKSEAPENGTINPVQTQS